jgi:hypothetical protein
MLAAARGSVDTCKSLLAHGALLDWKIERAAEKSRCHRLADVFAEHKRRSSSAPGVALRSF